jgi:CheY-like chemotaxis protein
MSKRKILIVDDEAPIRALLVSALGAPGNEVLEAKDGSDAIQLASQHRFFDLIVTDIMMPGMNGIELARRLRTARHARSFLFVSGFAQVETVGHILEEFDRAELLHKPFSITELLRAVSRLCEESPPSLARNHVQPPAA